MKTSPVTAAWRSSSWTGQFGDLPGMAADVLGGGTGGLAVVAEAGKGDRIVASDIFGAAEPGTPVGALARQGLADGTCRRTSHPLSAADRLPRHRRRDRNGQSARPALDDWSTTSQCIVARRRTPVHVRSQSVIGPGFGLRAQSRSVRRGSSADGQRCPRCAEPCLGSVPGFRSWASSRQGTRLCPAGIRRAADNVRVSGLRDFSLLLSNPGVGVR